MSALDGPRAKLDRAREHLAALEGEVQEFLGSGPVEVITEVDPVSGEFVDKVKVTKTPPLHLATVTGDAIHNLRATLDLLWITLVQAQGHTIEREDSFRISDTKEKFEAGFKAATLRIDPKAAGTIEALEPYEGGAGNNLWRLHNLDIQDKHKLLLVTAASRLETVIPVTAEISWPEVGFTSTGEVFNPAEFFKEGLRFPGGDPVSDGEELFRRSRDEDGSGFLGTPKYVFDVVLREPPFVEREPLVPLLHRFVGEIEAALSSVGQFI